MFKENFGQEIKGQISKTPVLIGVSEEANRIREFAEKVAKGEETILIQGESGTGKDHLAELIHFLGKQNEPFVPVDCGALTEGLSENELFGHIQGAYTDARKSKRGLVEIAQGGTLFFNEIANMSLILQGKFLRILDKTTFRPVGGIEEKPVNTRIIAATNANLELAVRQGKLRLDLYHRLNNIVFTIAPLRDRSDDIPSLVEYFLLQKRVSKFFSLEVITALMKYQWPGNIRELKNAVTKAIFHSGEGNIKSEHICPYFTSGKNERMNGKLPSFYQLQKEYLCEIIKKTQGDISEVVRISGLAEKTVYNKIEKLKLQEIVLSARTGENELDN